MFGRLTRNGRIWVLLLAWLFFVGLSWADTFDLSDDIVLPVAAGQAIVDLETSEIKSNISILVAATALWTCLPFLSVVEKPLLLAQETCAVTSEIPLHQRLSIYRI
jgi:hypothetical protein